MPHGLNMGWRKQGLKWEQNGTEGFAIKSTVVLVRSTSVAEVVGWVSSETVEVDRASAMST